MTVLEVEQSADETARHTRCLDGTEESVHCTCEMRSGADRTIYKMRAQPHHKIDRDTSRGGQIGYTGVEVGGGALQSRPREDKAATTTVQVKCKGGVDGAAGQARPRIDGTRLGTRAGPRMGIGG